MTALQLSELAPPINLLTSCSLESILQTPLARTYSISKGLLLAMLNSISCVNAKRFVTHKERAKIKDIKNLQIKLVSW